MSRPGPTKVREHGRTMSEPPALETVALTKRYGAVTALDDLSIRVEPGEVYGFLGPNGAGKTTTIRLLLGLARPTTGQARLFGLDSWTRAAEAHHRVGFVPGEFAVWPTLRGSEVLDLLGSVHGGYDRAYRDELCQRFAFDPSRRGREYSKGNRQKICLIAAFMVQPDLLMLDEPTTGLDPLMEIVFRDCVTEARDRGQAVFLSSHILSEVEAVCDRVAILRRGRLVQVGTLDDLRHLNAREVMVAFAGPPPDLAGVAGVEQVTLDGDTVRLRHRGPPGALLAAIAARDVVDLDIREPSLEELFLTYYGDPEGGDGGADGAGGADGPGPSGVAGVARRGDGPAEPAARP
jgi:ABC-2 type transport system ATP-binding protein